MTLNLHSLVLSTHSNFARTDHSSQSKFERDVLTSDVAMRICASVCLALTTIRLILEWTRLPLATRRPTNLLRLFVIYGRLLSWAACVILSWCQLGLSFQKDEKCQNTDVNSDISGIGIRLALYMPMYFTLATLVGCVFWSHDFGTKELGGTQLISKRFLLWAMLACVINGQYRFGWYDNMSLAIDKVPQPR
jgi:hypothetical protein